MVWLVSVTLCSARLLAEAPHEHPVAPGHSDHDHHHDGKQKDDSCGCESFKAFPAQTTDASKIFAPATALPFALLELNDFAISEPSPTLRVQNTGPPDTESFTERFLQQCLLSQAPPVAA